MKYAKGSIDYKVNLVSLHEMEEVVPMTSYERARLRNWVKDGHDVESNPWNYLNDDGSEMNYLQCLRILNGYSHGPLGFLGILRSLEMGPFWPRTH